jgi:two-component system cell cycle sensor histidine kinase PleC
LAYVEARAGTARDTSPEAHSPIDPRILLSWVERGAQALASGAMGAPPWILITAVFCSDAIGVLGHADFSRAIAAVSIVLSAAIFARLGFFRFKQAQRIVENAAEARNWFRRIVALNLLMSSALGLVPWLLWQPGHLPNHMFLALISLTVVGRFLVSRGGHIAFFAASFGPLALLLLSRFLIEGGTAELLLATLIPIYALHFGFDVRRHSQRMDSEAELRFANEDLARALQHARDEALRKRYEAEQANQSKTAFLANMSHELRTPLNAILGFSEIIARECLGSIGNTKYREYAGDIHSSGTHLLSLINELLDVAKIEAGRMEIAPALIDTKPMFESSLKLIALRARERQQSLSVQITPDADVFCADERAFKQILINLAANAVKFTQEGGTIVVSARRNMNGDFQLMVADNGPGIPKENLELVFKPFAQIDNRYDRKTPGTGLGLALVRGLAQLHGGRAWIESETGKGTRAYVTLPMPNGSRRPAHVA